MYYYHWLYPSSPIARYDRILLPLPPPPQSLLPMRVPPARPPAAYLGLRGASAPTAAAATTLSPSRAAGPVFRTRDAAGRRRYASTDARTKGAKASTSPPRLRTAMFFPGQDKPPPPFHMSVLGYRTEEKCGTPFFPFRCFLTFFLSFSCSWRIFYLFACGGKMRLRHAQRETARPTVG